MGEIKVGKYIVLDDRLYTETDEWVKIDGDVAVVGITDYAQKKLRDIIGIELPKVNQEVKAGDPVGTIESVKAASDLYSPLSGVVVEVNEELETSPEIINKDPYGEGWMFKIKIKDKSEAQRLLTPEKYIEKIRGE